MRMPCSRVSAKRSSSVAAPLDLGLLGGQLRVGIAHLATSGATSLWKKGSCWPSW
jgi:hypothetical protein